MSNESKGTSFLMVVQLILLSFKLNGVGAIAALSWGVILIPLWIWIAMFIFLFVLYLVVK